jgi:serine/threonine-protein kinase RsbW
VSIQIVMMLPPKAASVSLARHALADALRIPGVSPECINEAQVALSEACSNFLRRLRADRSFEVLINIGDTELTVHILDSDVGFPGPRNLADWPEVVIENDHGLALMTAFSDHASFDSRDEGGSVRLKKQLRWDRKTALPPSG